MKKLLFYSLIAVVLYSCSSNDQNSSKDSYSKVISTDIENIDSLSNVKPSTWKNLHTLTEGVAHSGVNASRIDSLNLFSFTYEQKLGNLDINMPKSLTFTAWGYALNPNPEFLMVVSVNNEKFYQGFPVQPFLLTENEWYKMEAKYKLPKNLKESDVIKAYVWNYRKGEMLVDDITLQFEY